jgi:ComF family protein
VVDLGDVLPLLAPFVTGKTLLHIIHTIKFQRYRGLSGGAAAAMAAVLADRSDLVGADPVLIAVPMDTRALRKRGFNQSADLARGVARTLRLEFREDALVKFRRTRPQSLTPRRDRTENVRNAFAVRGNAVRGRDVLIVDDLVTTGATVRACSEVLRIAGAASTAVISLGRSPLAGAAQRHRKTPFLLS